jgi:L-ascorbate metabolism protein UlaG (beta-lactamase superfamily)
MLENVEWLGHAGFRITGAGNVTVVIDPYEVRGGSPASLVLITHDHYDHFSPADAARFIGPGTAVVGPACVTKALKGDVRTVKPGDETEAAGVRIRAVPAYNHKIPNHARNKGHVGYAFVLDGVAYYHAGDTDRIPEMKSVKADVAFLPVGGTFTMDAEEAALAAADVGAKTAVPMHWGSVVGSKGDAERFRELCRCGVVIFSHE